MELFESYKLEQNDHGFTIILYLNRNLTEFAEEITHGDKSDEEKLSGNIEQLVEEICPGVPVNLAKIMIGSLLVATITLSGIPTNVSAEALAKSGKPLAAPTTTAKAPSTPAPAVAMTLAPVGTAFIPYKVGSGDSLWTIAKKFDVTVDRVKTLNGMTNDTVYPGNTIKIPVSSGVISYRVQPNESLWNIAQKFGVTVAAVKSLNNMSTDMIQTGQALKIPVAGMLTYKVASGDTLWTIATKYNVSVPDIKKYSGLATDSLFLGQSLVIPLIPSKMQAEAEPVPAPKAPPNTITYTVAPGDTLWLIAKRFNVSIDNIRALNGLKSDYVQVGQDLYVPVPINVQKPTVTYTTHKIAHGDDIWSLSVKYGIPMLELLRANNLTERSMLQIGQVLRIPVHIVPVKQTPGPQYGEYLDWWTEAQYVFPIGKVAKVTDFKTKRVFYVKRTIGANHADCEPLTAKDSAIMKEIWGGNYSWATRAVIIEVDGRKIAASIASMPHSIEFIKDNNFTGHFDIHFLNSTRHKDGEVDWHHQNKIKTAAGINQ